MPERKLRVFLCHASQDKPIVRELYQRLNAEGWIDPWLDEEKLLPGQDWGLEIEKAVDSADVVIVCISSKSVVKEGYVQKEMKNVLDKSDEKPEGTIFVIPVRLDDCEIPRRINKRQYVDYFPLINRSVAYKRLLPSLRLRAENLSINVSEFIPRIDYSQGYSVYKIGDIDFVKIPRGSFLMGSSEQDELAYSIEKPQHRPGMQYEFLISRFEISNHQFEQFTEGERIGKSWGAPGRKKKPDHPVVNISWNLALDFCSWFSEQNSDLLPKGRITRLPTEAEWEKSARGTDGRLWPWGNDFEVLRCNFQKGRINSTTPIDAFSQQGDSPYHVADMAGNVFEWTMSLLKKYPYNSTDGRENPKTPGNRVLRGGSFDSASKIVRCACRSNLPPNLHVLGVGFRIVIAPPIM